MKTGLCPDMPLFANDWLASPTIALMTPAEEGAYLHLLCYAWGEEDCSLPDDDEALAAMSRLGEAWAAGSGAKIRRCFMADPARPGRIFNPRQRQERLRQMERLRQASERGRNAVNSRWSKKSEKPYVSNTDVLPANQSGNAPDLHGNTSSPGTPPSSLITQPQSQTLNVVGDSLMKDLWELLGEPEMNKSQGYWRKVIQECPNLLEAAIAQLRNTLQRGTQVGVKGAYLTTVVNKLRQKSSPAPTPSQADLDKAIRDFLGENEADKQRTVEKLHLWPSEQRGGILQQAIARYRREIQNGKEIPDRALWLEKQLSHMSVAECL